MLFIDIFLANLCLMSRITMIEARPMPQYLHTFHPMNHPAPATTNMKMSMHLKIPRMQHLRVCTQCLAPSLSKANHECHHEREQPCSFREGETQNGIREQLSSHARVASHTGDQAPKDRPNTHTGTSKTDCSETGTDVSASDDHGFSELGGERANHLRRQGCLECVADLLTLKGLEWGLGGTVVLEGAAHS